MSAKSFVIGLTGPSSAGKNTVAQGLRKALRAQIIDADTIGHGVYEKGRPAYVKIVRAFGKGVIGSSGQIDRRRLSEIVFKSPAALKKLNAITHPAIRREIQNQIKKSKSKTVVINAALLEVMDKNCLDEIWVVLAPQSVRVKRLMKDRKISRAMALKRIRSQKPDSYYESYADVIIRNHGPKKGLARAVRALLPSHP